MSMIVITNIFLNIYFRTAPDDKCRRMRAYLSCMRSDTPLMLNTTYVPQHLLILATVLR